MKITLPKKTEEEPLFLVEDSDKRPVFEIARDGIIRYMTPEGVLETVADIEVLALAFVGMIHAILANPDTNKKGIDTEAGAVEGAIKEMKAVLAKLEVDKSITGTFSEPITGTIDGQTTI